MKITAVESRNVVIPLDQPVRMAGLTVRERDFALVRIEAEGGHTGVGYTLARGADVAGTIERHLRPLLVGEDALLTERLWEGMYRGTLSLSRKGLLMRAISAVDIALWDLKGKAAGMPLYQLLGGHKNRVPAFVAGGYYREDHGLSELADEMRAYVDAGFSAVKLMIGAAPPDEDVARTCAAREAVGADAQVMVDVNGGWREVKPALRLARRLEEYELAFIEEPFPPDQLPAMAAFTAGVDTPVAIGEFESGRWAFREILQQEAADILRPDATLIGGISEWLKVAGLAAAWDVPIVPHFFPDVHAHLAAAVPQASMVEVMVPPYDTVQFNRLLRDPLRITEGCVEVPERPGLGLEIDWPVVERLSQCRSAS
jgi:D-arabinonate dehydratase